MKNEEGVEEAIFFRPRGNLGLNWRRPQEPHHVTSTTIIDDYHNGGARRNEEEAEEGFP